MFTLASLIRLIVVQVSTILQSNNKHKAITKWFVNVPENRLKIRYEMADKAKKRLRLSAPFKQKIDCNKSKATPKVDYLY